MASSPIDVDDDDFMRPEIIQSYINKFQQAATSNAALVRHSKASLDWFRKRVSKDLRHNRRRLLRDHGDYRTRAGRENKTLIGRLYFFEYAAEEAGDRELGVYDRFPMVFIFNTSLSTQNKKLIHAINMHYLVPRERAVVYLKLMKLRNKKGWTHATKLKASWELLKSVADHELLQRAVHSYRVDRIINHKMVEIHAADWEIATFLRLEQWINVDVGTTADQKGVRKQQRERSKRR
jgi:hypothetical protein